MNKFKFLPFIAAAAVITGCQEYDLGLTVDEIRYKESFTNAFGQIDPNQNWDLYGQLAGGAKSGMTRAGVNTSIGEFTIVDNLTPVELTDEQVLQYTKMMPEEALAGQPYSKTNLGRVTQNFTANVSELTLYPIYWNTSGADEIGLYYYADENTEGAVQVKGEWIVRVPITSNKKNIKQITWAGRGVQPVMGASSNWSAYWPIIVELWDELVKANPERYIVSDGTQSNCYGQSTTSGEKLVFATTTSGDYANTPKYYHQDAFSWDSKIHYVITEDLASVSNGKYAKMDNDLLGQVNEGTKTIETNDFTGQDVSSILTTGAPSIQSTGTKVTFPAKTQIGMYIKQSSDIMYSEYKLNNQVKFMKEDKSGDEADGRDVSYVATYQLNDEEGNPILDEDGKKIQYLCFEDWFEDDNFDLNDCVFRVFGIDESTIVDPDNYTEEALLVCEDLGDFDFDFNDVVLKLSYVNAITKVYHYVNGVVESVTATNEESIKVTPMAAGGANPSTVTIHPANGSGEDIVLGEIHALLGGAAPSIINAGPTFGTAGTTVEYPVTTYGAAWDKTVYPTYLSMLFDKGFIKITSSGANANKISSYGSYTETGKAPQMMLLPMSFEWPQEREPLKEVYEGFSSWVGDSKVTDWISSNNGLVTKR